MLFRGDARVTLADIKRALGVVSSTMQDQIRVHVPAQDIVAGGLFGSLGIPQRLSLIHISARVLSRSGRFPWWHP